MNRTERLYALVEELRAAAPRQRTVAALAARFETSTRTVQRDLQALMAAGVPVRNTPGRGGGWSIDPAMTLPPIRFTTEEAAALATALAAADTPAAATAAQKIAASLTGSAELAARELAARIVALPSPYGTAVRTAVEHSITTGTVLRLDYRDAAGSQSERLVEPAGLLTAGGRWYLIAWCRTRRAGRGFRLDRIAAATPTHERARPRDLHELLRDSTASAAVRPRTLDPLAQDP